MSRVYWDTMLFVYWLDDVAPYSQKVKAIRQRMNERRDQLCASTFTLAELLVAPEKRNDRALADRIVDFFSGPSLEVLPLDRQTAKQYAKIRATQKVSPADAIHLSCAAAYGVDLFLTNDFEVRKLVVPGIQFIDGLDTSALGPLGP